MRLIAIAAIGFATLATVLPAGAQSGLDRALVELEAYDYPRAVASLRTAADDGDRRAQRILGFMLLHGEGLYRGVAVDRAQAVAWLRKAALAGDEQAAWFVARLDGNRNQGLAAR
jgi:TPR repeat protein